MHSSRSIFGTFALALVCVVLIGRATGATLHFNPAFEKECASNIQNNNGSNACIFNDAKYWIEKQAPANRDDVVIASAGIALDVILPININSLQAVTTEDPTTFSLTVPFGINNLNSRGRVVIQQGTLTLSSLLTVGESIELSGTVSLFNADVEMLLLDSGNFTATNITVRNFMVLDWQASLVCESLTSLDETFLYGTLQCGNLSYLGSFFTVAQQVTADHMILSGSRIQILSNAVLQALQVEILSPDLLIQGTLASTKPIQFSGIYSTIQMDGGVISTPAFAMTDGVIQGFGTLIADVTTYSNTDIHLAATHNLTIVGNVNMTGGSVQWSLTSEDGITVMCGQININGTIHKAQFALTFVLDQYLPLPAHYVPLVRFTNNTVNMSDLNSLPTSAYANSLVFAITSNDISFMWLPFTPPVQPPVGAAPVGDVECRLLDKTNVVVSVTVMAAVIMGLLITVATMASKMCADKNKYDIVN